MKKKVIQGAKRSVILKKIKEEGVAVIPHAVDTEFKFCVRSPKLCICHYCELDGKNPLETNCYEFFVESSSSFLFWNEMPIAFQDDEEMGLHPVYICNGHFIEFIREIRSEIKDSICPHGIYDSFQDNDEYQYWNCEFCAQEVAEQEESDNDEDLEEDEDEWEDETEEEEGDS